MTAAPTPGTPNAPHGLRISRIPNRPVERTTDGHLTIHLWLQRDTRFEADLALRLTPAEAEVLHAQLCYALDAEPITTPPNNTPDCRKPNHGHLNHPG